MELTPAQLDILRHMLGINTPAEKIPVPHRDYFCASKGDERLQELERAGAVECYRRDDNYDWYTTTEAGEAAARASFKFIRRSKGSRMYSKFLDIADCFPDLTFKGFLTDPQFAETRRNA